MLTDDELIRIAFLTHLPLHLSTWAQLLHICRLSADGRAVLTRWVQLRLRCQPGEEG